MKDKGLLPLGPRCGGHDACDAICCDDAWSDNAHRFDSVHRFDIAHRSDSAHRADAHRFDEARSSGDCGHDACRNVAIRFDDAHHTADSANRCTAYPPRRGEKRRSSFVSESAIVSHNATSIAPARRDVFSAPSPWAAPRAPWLYPHPLEIGIAFLAGAWTAPLNL